MDRRLTNAEVTPRHPEGNGLSCPAALRGLSCPGQGVRSCTTAGVTMFPLGVALEARVHALAGVAMFPLGAALEARVSVPAGVAMFPLGAALEAGRTPTDG